MTNEFVRDAHTQAGRCAGYARVVPEDLLHGVLARCAPGGSVDLGQEVVGGPGLEGGELGGGGHVEGHDGGRLVLFGVEAV